MLSFNREHLYTIDMAQVLKDEFREKIHAAALQEFFDFGFDDASMRKIALKADMSVGNLYRYYPNKEQLFNALVADTLHAFNQVILEQKETDIDSSLTRKLYFGQRIKSLTQDLLVIYEQHQTEMLILLRYSKLNDRIVLSIKHWIDHIIVQWFPQYEPRDAQIDFLCHMLAQAVFAGLSKFFEEAYTQKQPIQYDWIIETYLNLFTMMLEAGDTQYEA